MAKRPAHPWWRAISDIAERLGGSEVFEVRLSAVRGTDEAVLAAAEARIGGSIPAPLRSFYAEVGDAAFYWRVRRGLEHELGLDRSHGARGQFELVPASMLRVGPPGWVRFTNDGSGNGFVFATSGGEAGHYDEDADEVDDDVGSLDEAIAGWTERGFPTPGVDDSLTARIASGALAPQEKPKLVAGPVPPGAKQEAGPLLQLEKTYAVAVGLGRRRAVVAEQSGLLRTIDLASGAVVLTRTAADGLLTLALVDDDLAVTASMRDFEIWRLDTGARVAPRDESSSHAAALAVVPGTRRLVAGSRRGLVLWNLDTATIQAMAHLPTSSVAVSRQGLVLALGTSDDGQPALHTWSVASANGVQPASMGPHGWPGECALFAHEDLALFPHESGLAAYDLARDEWRIAPPEGAKFRRMGALLPNGDVLVTHVSEPKLLRLRAGASGVVAEQALPCPAARTAMAVDPDGTSAIVAFGDGSIWVVPVPPG